MKKVNIFKLEDRVLFDAAGVADAVDAANQAASAEASAAQEQAQDSKEALKNAPPENPADAAANAQAQQNHSNPGEAADLDAAANKIVEGEIVPGQAPEQADAPADGADADHTVQADTDGQVPDADHAAAESQGGDAGDSGDAGDAGDINDVPLGDIDDFINGGHDSDADHDGDAEHNAEQDSADADKPAPALDAVPAAANADAPGRELVIINSSVKDAQSIIDALGDNTDVLFLEKGTDALDAINEYLDAKGIKYDAIHIVSHGNAGYFVLNGEIIDAQSVANDPASWANIGKHLSDNGDIMIYGCNVAGNLDGQMLVSQIASLTGADVAASVDSTGVNGNWDLEYSIGVIDNHFLNVNDYQYSLASYTISGTDSDKDGVKTYGTFQGAYDDATRANDKGAEFVFTINADGKTDDTGKLLDGHTNIVAGDFSFGADTDYVFSGGKDVVFGGSITLDGDISFTGNYTFNSGVTIGNTVTLNGTFNVNGGTTIHQAESGDMPRLDMQDGGKAVYNLGAVELSNGVMIGSGVTAKATSISETLLSYGYVYNYGTLEVSGAIEVSSIINGYFNSSTEKASITAGSITVDDLTNYNLGTIKTGNLDTLANTSYGSVSNYGTLQVSGEFSAYGVTNDGTLTVGNAANGAGLFNLTGTMSGTGNVQIYSNWTGDGTVNMTGGYVYFQNHNISSFQEIYQGNYYDLGVKLANGDYAWSGVNPNDSVAIGHQLSMAVGYNSKFVFDTAYTGNMEMVNFYNSGATLGSNAYSNSVTVTFSKAFMDAYKSVHNPDSDEYIMLGGNYGNLVLGADGDEFAALTFAGGLTLHGTYIDLTRVTDSLTLKEFKSDTYGFQLRVASLDHKTASVKIVYDGDGTIAQLYDDSGNILSYTDLEVTGALVVNSGANITVTGQLKMNQSSSLTINGRFTVGSFVNGIISTDGRIVDDGTVKYTVGAGGTLTLNLVGSQNLVRGALTVRGTANLNVADMAFGGDIEVYGGTLNITSNWNTAGGGTTFDGVVGSGSSGGTINIEGDNLVFSQDVTNALGWYTINGYMKYDNAQYASGSEGSMGLQSKDGLNAGLYDGTINVKATNGGSINFNKAVVSTGTFNINGGRVIFGSSNSAFVAIAAGTFTIKAGSDVTFGNDVFVSATFNSTRDTVFTIEGGKVSFSKDLWNWVRTWRGWVTNEGTDKQRVAGDLMTYINADKKYFADLYVTRAGVSSTVNFKAGSNVTFAKGTLYNYGSFGVATVNIEAGAMATLYNVKNAAYNAWTPYSASPIGEVRIVWDSDLLGLYGYDSSPVHAGGVHPSSPIKAGTMLTGSSFNIFADNITIGNSVLNSGGGAAQAQYAGHMPHVDNAGFHVEGSNNKFSGTFTNEKLGFLSITNGTNNQFSEVINGKDGHLQTKVLVSGTQRFETFQNYADLSLISAQKTQIGLINQGGDARISGDSDGLTFTRLDVNGGSVTISSKLGTAGITSDINVTNGATLHIEAENTIYGNVVNSGQIDMDGEGSVFNGTITNQADGSFNINKAIVINNSVNNLGAFKIDAPNMVFEHEFQNSGTLFINKITTFTQLINQVSGKISMASSAAGEAGAEGTTFANLVNMGVLDITVSGVLFTDSLTNSGTLNIKAGSNGTRFKNMVDAATGEIRFLNSGILNINAQSGTGEFMDVNNTGTINVSQNVNFGKVINAKDANIVVANTGELRFFGEITNDGVISGAGDVFFYFSVNGSGSFNMSAESKVTYHYDAETNYGPDSTTVYKDSDGYWRIGGIRIGDAYSNRPVYDPNYGWIIPGANPPVKISGFNQYVDVTVGLDPDNPDGNYYWYIGGKLALDQSGDAIMATDNTATPQFNDTTETWFFGNVNTGISGNVVQNILGGNLVNLTVGGGAYLADGVGVTVTGNTVVSGEFTNQGVGVVVSGNTQLSFNGKYTDTQDSWLKIAGSGKVVFDVKTATDPSTSGGRTMAVVNGSVINDGTIQVADYKAVSFLNATSGNGRVAAGNGMVAYDNTGTSGDQKIFATGSSSYNELELRGSEKTIDGQVTVGTLLNDATGISLEKGTLTVNQKATGNGDYTVGSESRIDFNSQAGNGYEIGGDIEIQSDAFGVGFNGVKDGLITVAGKVTNYVVVDGTEVRRTGVTASNTKFTDVDNYGTFIVKDSGVKLGNFVQFDKAQLIFALQAGDTFVIDGSDSSVSGTAGEVVVNADSTLELAAAGQELPFVIVDKGATLVVTAETTLGSLEGKVPGESGLVLNGTLKVEAGGDLLVYAYATGDIKNPTAVIYVGSNGTLEFYDDMQYGFVYAAAIEVAGGTLKDTVRIDFSKVDTWIVIDSSKTAEERHTSYYVANSKFIVKDGVTLIVDGYLGMSPGTTEVVEGAFRLENGMLDVQMNLTVNGDVTVDDGSRITVNSNVTATFGGAVSSTGLIRGDGNLVFNGSITNTGFDAQGNAVEGEVSMTGNSVVTYGENAGSVLFAGTYVNLVVNNIAAVGDVMINGSISTTGSGSLTFNGGTKGTGKVVADGHWLGVTYGKDADIIYGGDYGSLTFIGDHTVNAGKDGVLAITVKDAFSIEGGSANAPATLTLNNTQLTLKGTLANTDSARIVATGKSGRVTYDYSGYMERDIYSGTYRELEVIGAGVQRIADLSLDTQLLGTGSLMITSSVGGSGAITGGKLSVTYGENIDGGFLRGEYKNLTIYGAGNKVIDNDITVSGNTFAMGTFTGKGNLVFDGLVQGSAIFGTATSAYAGSVTYSASAIAGQNNQMVYSGNYSSLNFSGLDKTIDADVEAGALTMGSSLAIGGDAVVTLHQVSVTGSAVPKIQVSQGTTLNITMTANVVQPILVNSGTLVVSSNGDYTFENTDDSIVLINDGVFRVAGNSNVTLSNIKMNNKLSSYEVGAGSTLTLQGFNDATIAGITNNGSLNLSGSNLTVTGAVVNTGTFTVKEGSTLTLEGNSTLDGIFRLEQGNVLNVYGDVRINNLSTSGTIQVGSEDGRTGSLTLYKVSAGNEDPSSSTMIAYEGSTLKFDPYTVFQMIGGTVTVWQTPDHNPLQYDSNWTGFYNLVIETSWIIVNEDGYVIDVATDGKYWIQGGAHVTVNGCGAGSQFRVDGDCELTFSITATEGNPDAAVQSVEVYAGGKVVIDSALSVTGSFTNSGDVTVNAAGTKFASFTNNAGASLTLNAALNAESKVENMAGGTITVNAAMTLDGNISNYGTISVTTAGVTVNGLVNTGIVQVGEAGVLTVETDLGGTLNVLENGQAVINVGALTANVENAGTVTAGTGTLTFNGAVAGNGGTFSGDSLTFSGITSGTATVEAADVIYNGTDSQSVFGGTYGTLTLDGGLKTVTGKTEVTGVFTNNSGVQVDGSLTLNGLAGAGEYLVSQNGMLVFNGDGTVAGSVTNSGTVEVNALVSFGGGLSNLATGTLNLNATGLNVTADNAGVINVNAQNVTLSGSNSKTVNVADGGSLTLKMTDAAGANYTVAAGGVLNLDSASGTLFGRVDNAGTFNVISEVNSFVGGVSNSGTMVVESASNLANVTNSNLLILNGAAKLNGTVNDGTIQLNNGGVSVEGLANNGILDITVGYTFDASKFANDGLVKVSNGATVIADNIGANGSSGDYSVEANSTLNAGTGARFTGVLQNDGTISGNGNLITISGSTAGSGSLNNSSGEVVYNGADAQDIFSGEYGRLTVTGDGTKTLNGDITINTNGNISSSFVNNGAITSDGVLIFDGKTFGNGTVNSTAETIYNQAAEHVYSGKYGKLTLSGVAKSIAGNVTADLLDNSARTLTVETSGVLTTGKLADDVNSQYNILGTWNFTGDAEILGSVNNSGVISTDSDLTFTGMTTGSGRIEISNTTGAVKYSGNADHEIYSGNYNDLTIDGTGNNTLSGDVKVNGTMSLDTRLNASGSLTLSGDTTGEGQLHSTGSVVYDRNGDQDIYNGSYKDITIDGNGVKSIVGNVTISGNAVQSGGAVLHASNGNVTYNGNGTQQVMNGTYEDLTLNGTGQKLFAAGSLTTVNGTFTATGSPSQLLYLDSTIPGRQWDVAAGNLNFNWVHISNSNLLSGGADLNGNNSLGSGNTGWKVFDSAGGIGDSFPSQNNLNFSSLAMLLGNELRAAELEELFYEEGFVFRRSGSLPKLDPNGDDIAAVLQSEVDFLGLETAYDTAIFDGADFSDADYSDLMSRADIFKDEVDEALSEMVAI